MSNSAKNLFLLCIVLSHFLCALQAQQISGFVYIDKDGLTDNNINTSAGISNTSTNIGGLLYANLLNNAGLVVSSTAVLTNGSYTFANLPLANYLVQLSINNSNGTFAIPVSAPATALAIGWVNTGEFIGNMAGNDGSINGKSDNIIITQNAVIENVNFGIEKMPETLNMYVPVLPSPTAAISTIILDNVNIHFKGSDAEDLPTVGSLTGKKIKIDTLFGLNTGIPQNGMIVELYYDNNLINEGQIIPTYNPSLLKLKCYNYSPNFDYSTKLKYSYIDVANFKDTTPAVYQIIFPVAAVPVTLVEFSATNNNCNATIHWKTTTEINTDKYEVECATNENNSFKTLATLNVLNTNEILKTYQFNTALQPNSAYYFRLKLIDKDGNFTYSEIKKTSCVGSKEAIALVPNITSSLFKVLGLIKGKNSIAIYNVNGVVIKTIENYNNNYIDIGFVEAGNYFVQIKNESGVLVSKKLIKIN